MITKDEFDSLYEEALERMPGEWSEEGGIEQSFIEAEALAEALAEKQKLKQVRELIEKSHQERCNEKDQ